MELALSWARVIFSVVLLLYASWSDFKTREISNNVWVIFGPIAFLLTTIQFLFFPPIGDVFQSMIYYGISFAVTSVFSIVLFYAGAFGGADAKALICIALAMPLSPEFVKPLSGYVSPVFPITVFSNSVIIAALSVFYAIFRNFFWKARTKQKLFEGYQGASLGRKALAMLSGYKVKVADLEKSFLYPLEDLHTTQSGETERHLLIFPKDENKDEIVGRLVKAESEGKLRNMVWATPGLPMLIFITVGLILALTLGDIVWIALRQIL